MAWFHRCTRCNYIEDCKINTDTSQRLLPPMSQRGRLPSCFICKHTVWRVDRDRKTRVCMFPLCKDVKPLNEESAEVKHQR